MDVSTSTSFETSPDKRNSTYVGDNTLYDSALDHQLSTTAYKTCNGKQSTQTKAFKTNRIQSTEEQVDHISNEKDSPASKSYETEWNKYSEGRMGDENPGETQSENQIDKIFQLIRCLPEDTKDYDLCRRWLDAFQNSNNLEKHSVQRLLRKMEYQLITSGHLSAPFTDLTNLENLLNETSNDTSDSEALSFQKTLKEEHDHLERKIEVLKLKLAALQIKTNHQQQKLRKLNLLNDQKSNFSKNIKKTLMMSARQTLQSQVPETFPTNFISQIFVAFAGDEKLINHFKTLDYELKKIVQKIAIHAYERQKPSIEAIISDKFRKLKYKLIDKYENQLAKQEEGQQSNALAMQQKCFNLLKQFLMTDCPDESCGEDYLKNLEVLYEKEISKE